MKKKEVKDLGNRQGTAVQQKGRARVKQILDAATALLIEEGYGQFTMRQLSERLDIRLSNLQYYFPSRTLLIQKLLERFLEDYIQQISQFAVEQENTARQRVFAAIDYLLRDQQQEESCKIFWELWALSARNPEISEVMNSFYSAYIDTVAEMLQELNLEVSSDKTKKIAVLIVSMIEGLSLVRGFGKKPHSFLSGIESEVRNSVLHLMNIGLED